MNLRIITPHGIKFEGEVSRIQFPAATGLMEILDGHAPLIAAVREGEAMLDDNLIDIGGGVLKVENNNVTIVCE
ncbi:MAG: hypothetical protein IJR86_06495 [Bacteroidaceae bacterium]|jgi:F-type H+-transporting ATPase subunit epsilon|nr:hypothetical protein [Bacteroidaceae bacterium]